MIKNIIFDVGKVLIDWNPLNTMKELGFNDDEITQINLAIYESGAWQEEDRGLISHEDMYDYLASKCPPLADKIRLFYDHATDSVKLMPYTHEWLMSLHKAGYKLYILSNFGEFAWNRAISLGAIDFLDMVDGKVVSYEIKHVKPEPEIFKELLSRYNLNADECVFIDDSPVNVSGAIENGIPAIIFTGYEEAIAKLREMGVN